MNSIRAENGSEVYASQIHELADEYLSETLTEEERNSPKVDSTVFSGMLNRIYTQLFKPNESNMEEYKRNSYQNVRQNSILDYNDIETLDHLFNVYCDLCGKCRACPSLLGFGSMVGISKETFFDWANGGTRKDSPHTRTCKRWKSICEASLEQRAVMSNSIGSIFALKANYGWKEADNTPTDQITTNEVRSTPEQLAEKYGMIPKPEIPQFIED